jgi:hypothetical protein
MMRFGLLLPSQGCNVLAREITYLQSIHFRIAIENSIDNDCIINLLKTI